MDEKDFRLLAELVRHPLASHAQLGRAANVSALSAERRLHNLEAEFILAGFFALPAAAILGRTGFIASASPTLSKTLYPARLLSEPDVVWVTRNYDGGITMCVYLPAGKAPDAIGLEAAAGWRATQAPRRDLDEEVFSETDWRIIDALIDHPRAEINELARRTGLPVRTANDRRDKLVSIGAMEVQPVVLAPQGPGTLVYILHVRLRSKEAAEKVRQAAEGALLMEEIQEPPALIFLGRARAFATVQDLQARLAAMPGVADVGFILNREAAIARDRLHEWVSEAAGQRRPGKGAKRAP